MLVERMTVAIGNNSVCSKFKVGGILGEMTVSYLNIRVNASFQSVPSHCLSVTLDQ